MSFNASWVMVTWDPVPPVDRQTDTTKNFTFPQLRWQEVKNVKVSQDGSQEQGCEEAREQCFSVPTECECKNFKLIRLQQVGFECL